MSLKNKKTKEFSVDFSANQNFNKPSPYVLDLRKIVARRSELKNTLPIPAKKFLEKSPLPKLTFLAAFIFFGKLFKKIFVSGFKSALKNFFAGVGRAGDFLFRFFQFFRFSLADYKKIFSFGLLTFIFILPLQVFSYYETIKTVEKKTLDGAESAYENFLTGGTMLVGSDFDSASENFAEAAGAFSQAQAEIGRINFIVSNLIKVLPESGEKFRAGEAILSSGEKFSWAGQTLSESLANFSAKDSGKKLTQKIKILRNRLVVILPEVTAAAEKLSKVQSGAIPEDKREIFEGLKKELPNLVGGLRDLISISDLMIKFLGDETEKRYLVVFQNPGELRPTGGFMGSIALLDFNQGEIANLEIPGGGSYDFQGSLREKIIAPGPMQLINARWELQDANWFPDFPASAEKIKWFYEKSGGPTVDGVIAVNANLVADLLAVVGEIEMPEYNKIIGKENFIVEIQKAVEVEYDKKENKPKQIIADLTPKLLKKILGSEAGQFGKILTIMAGALGEKDILFYSVFPEVEHEIKNFGWGGEIRAVGDGADYLLIAHTNIGGGKTDWVIDETIDLEVKISDDGSIKNKLIIKRAHHGVGGEPFSGVRNVDYMRVYVPAGSTLLSASGFEAPPEKLFEKPEDGYKIDLDLKNSEAGALIDAESGTKITSEFGKTVFGNWVQVDPGEEATATFEYLLPFKISFAASEKNWLDNLLNKTREENGFYQLLLQKQSGTRANFVGQVNFPAAWQPILERGDILPVGKNAVKISGNLTADKFYLLGFKK
jgi:hypothetical protein